MTIQKKIVGSMKSVSLNLVDREEEVRAMFACALAGENCVLLGPPGTGKSMVARLFSEVIEDSRHFEWLMTKFSTPDEVFGPISISALKQDQYRRVTAGKLPEAHTVFLDEIFKSSGAILNTLLAVFNEKVYHEGNTHRPVPLEFAIAASNEEPDDELKALYDRFLLRLEFKPVTSQAAFRRLMTIHKVPVSNVTLEEWEQAKEEVSNVVVQPEAVDSLFTVRDCLRTEFEISVSDRRARKSLGYLKAIAWLDGRAEVESEDVRSLVPVLCEKSSQRSKVEEAIEKNIVSHMGTAQRLFQSALAAFDSVPASGSGSEINMKIVQAGSDSKEAVKRLEELAGNSNTPRTISEIRGMIDKLKERGKELQVRLMESM